LPFDWLPKLLLALVLFEVCAARVVVGITKELAEHTIGITRGRTAKAKPLRSIGPQERSNTEDLAVARKRKARPPINFPSLTASI
jgi:hypothetical protein